jgi:two-component system OmpR family sensor kinase
VISSRGGARAPSRRLSLRARLLWAFLVPLVLVLSVVGAAATAALRQELVGQVDTRLAAAVERSFVAAGSGNDGADRSGWDGNGPDFLVTPGQADGTLGARVEGGAVTESGVIGARGHSEALTGAQEEAVAGVPPDGAPRTVDLGRLGDYRVVATTTDGGDVIVTGLPLRSTETALLRLAVVEGVAGLLGVVAAALAGSMVIGRTLRPLHRVAATAGRVAELPLSTGEVRLAERVPPADTDVHTEVGRVGTALNRLLDHVEDSLAARHASETQVRQFVADASHELRTPVTSIRGYAELLRRRGDELPEDVAQSLRRVESEAVRMSVLVNDLLLLARLDAGRELTSEAVDLTALVMDVVSDAHAAGPGHHWRVDLPGAAVLVPGDGGRLHQVLANLLANVRSHTPAGTTATTRLRAEDGRAVLEVIDDGPGIPADLRSSVFERFARGDSSRSRTAGSSGLGLAIVHAVVTGHGGTVTVTSEPGRTAFTVRLPDVTVAQPDPEPEPWDDEDGEPPPRTTAGAAGGSGDGP